MSRLPCVACLASGQRELIYTWSGMARFGKALVALALQPADSELVSYVANLREMGVVGGVSLVHVDEHATVGLQDRWKEASTRICGLLRGGISPDDVTSHLVEGSRADKLLAFSTVHRNDLILLGHLTSHNPRRSLARRLAMKAPCSVWLVPQGSPTRISGIIAPVDLSARSGDSLREAITIAKRAGLNEVTALHVCFDPTVVTYADRHAKAIHTDRNELNSFLESFEGEGIRIVPYSIEEASVAHAIHRVCKERAIDLIVMGTRGRSRAAAVLLGSETEQTLIESKIPILAVKHFGARRGLLDVLLDERMREREELKFG